MNEPSNHRRNALRWSDDVGAYTPPATLVERIDLFLSESYREIPARSERDTPSSVKHGEVTDVKNGVRADYKTYRKIHFSMAKCPKECPFCSRARASRVKAESAPIDEGTDFSGDLNKLMARKGIDFNPARSIVLGTKWIVHGVPKDAERVKHIFLKAGAKKVDTQDPSESTPPHTKAVIAWL